MIPLAIFAALAAAAAVHLIVTERRTRQLQAALFARWIKYLDARITGHDEVISTAAELQVDKIRQAQAMSAEQRKAREAIRVKVEMLERPEEPEN